MLMHFMINLMQQYCMSRFIQLIYLMGIYVLFHGNILLVIINPALVNVILGNGTVSFMFVQILPQEGMKEHINAWQLLALLMHRITDTKIKYTL